MCELACSSSKESEFNPDRSRIKVIDNRLEGWSRPSVCLQCDEPLCAAVCPSQAISTATTVQGDHVVQVDPEKCYGCQSCVMACPFGAISFFPKTKAIKCDLCGGSPECVKFCFYDCLSIVELTEQMQAQRKQALKALTIRACHEIGKREARRRREQFSQEASTIVPVRPRPELDLPEIDFDRMLRKEEQ